VFKIYEGCQPSCLGSSGKELIPRTYPRIPGSILRRNNAWPVCMLLRTSRISRPPLLGRKPVRKKKINYEGCCKKWWRRCCYFFNHAEFDVTITLSQNWILSILYFMIPCKLNEIRIVCILIQRRVFSLLLENTDLVWNWS
jgi:hypothetical protein